MVAVTVVDAHAGCGQNCPVLWTVDQFERWFVDYHGSDEARRVGRSVARRYGVDALFDDLRSEWYLAIRRTLDGYRRSRAPLPAWIDDEDAARKYVIRALHNVAITFGRQQGRASERMFEPRDDGRVPVVDDPRAVGPDEQAVANGGFAAMVADLNAELRRGTGGCPGCRSEVTVQVALGVIEMVLWSSSPSAVRVDGTGGRDEWSQLVYEVLDRLYPSRVPTEDGRRTAAARQFHQRCGRCARILLQRLAERHLGGGYGGDR